MIIAFDYDDTFTRDPDAWTAALSAMKQAGHQIIGVTMRYPEEARGMSMRYVALCDKLFFTSRKAKWYFLQERGIKVDVWIDDSPHWIMRDALA